ncbi:glycine receptor subunit alpha-4-like [Ptychodera flava]|uniref:glycine receptor subunit alpha-4-like n=1 Tax=Ptychodera flava TaxID=63121 RepID=UPI003969C5C3
MFHLVEVMVAVTLLTMPTRADHDRPHDITGDNSATADENAALNETAVNATALPTPSRGNRKNQLSSEELQSQIIGKLLDGYDRTIRPFASEHPVNVECDMYITSFDSIMETTMDYQVTMYFRQYWRDPRLEFNDTITIVLADDIRERFWVPDLFFVNVKQADFHYVTRENVYFRLTSTGDILYSLRLSLILSCQMDLRQFPMDNQYCGIHIEPYGYTTTDLLLFWKENKSVDWDKKMKLAQYELKGYTKSEDDNNLLVTGNFAHVSVEFILTRELGYYILQTYIPSIMLVVVSWVSFWVDVSAAPARVALGITTVLTFTTMSSGVSSQLPKVAYAKAIDIWLAACMVFVFAALLEFALANYLHALGQDRQTLSNFFRAQTNRENEDEISLNIFTNKEVVSNGRGPETRDQNMEMSSRDDIYTIENDQYTRRAFRRQNGYDISSPQNSATFAQTNRKQSKSNKLKRGSSYKVATALAYMKSGSETSLSDSLYAEGLKLKNKAIAIDRYSRYLFPLIFIVFNAGYWPVYLTDIVFHGHR